MLFRLIALLTILGLIGCESQVAPPLVEVTELTPREIEPGDRLEIHGVGFPQGRTGRVHLEGSVFRPGELPTHGVSIDVEGVVQAPDRLEVVVRDPFVERICGRGDHAAHATFRAAVEISFASSVPGAKPLVGHLRSATLDVLPGAAHAAILEDRQREGTKVLAFLGITAGAPTGRGLPIEQVRADSLAGRSGILVGDVIASVDGLHLLSVADVAPASARSMELALIHGDSSEEETKTLPLVAYSSERIPTEYAPAFLIVGLAIALLVVLVLPGPAALGAMELQIAARVRRTNVRALIGALFGGKHAWVLALLSAAIAVFALMPWVFGREIDGVVLLFASATLLVGARVAPERGALASLRTLFQSGLAVLAMAGALALAIAQVGAIELAELVHLQGGAPWQFTAARHPACAAVAIVYVAALLALARQEPWSLRMRAGVLLGAALGVMVFFGGWQVPGIAVSRPTSGAVLLAAGLFVAKTWLLGGALLGTTRVVARLRSADLQRLVARRLVPMLALAAALIALSRRFAPSLALETAFGGTLVAVGVLFAIRIAARVRAALVHPEPHASTVS